MGAAPKHPAPGRPTQELNPTNKTNEIAALPAVRCPHYPGIPCVRLCTCSSSKREEKTTPAVAATLLGSTAAAHSLCAQPVAPTIWIQFSQGGARRQCHPSAQHPTQACSPATQPSTQRNKAAGYTAPQSGRRAAGGLAHPDPGPREAPAPARHHLAAGALLQAPPHGRCPRTLETRAAIPPEGLQQGTPTMHFSEESNDELQQWT